MAKIWPKMTKIGQLVRVGKMLDLTQTWHTGSLGEVFSREFFLIWPKNEKWQRYSQMAKMAIWPKCSK